MRDPASIRLFLRAAALSIAFSAPAAAQNPPAKPPAATQPGAQTSNAVQRYRFRLLGVFDEATGEPIEGVEVRDVFSGLSSPTSKSGTVSLFFLPDSGSLVRLRKVGYEMQTFPVAISPADTAPLTVILRKAVQLATVTVTDSAPKYASPRLRDAVERIRTHAGGYFLDEAAMRKWDNSTMANALIARMPGLTSILGTRGETYFVSSRNPCMNAMQCKKPDCFIAVYIDGILSTQRADFKRVSPMDYAIAEFYPGGADEPPQYSSGPCGTLLLWTRER